MAKSTPSEVSGRDQDCSKYTIGWICVLSKQQVAATLLLDESHPHIVKHPNDPNTYSVGRMGQHNVAIACQPQNQGGSNIAATIAVWMTTTFPEIKLCLLVGLGCGIPNKVRLGDIVVGMPYDGLPGVVEWHADKKKTTTEMGHPPTILLSAIAKIKSKPRNRDSVVHYGLIASTSRSIRDKDSCDSLTSKLGNCHLLCIDTEASGLVTNFPCLVIRGIYDYLGQRNNSHKDWQGPAVAVTASFAKEVTSFLPVTEVACLPTIQSMGASVF